MIIVDDLGRLEFQILTAKKYMMKLIESETMKISSLFHILFQEWCFHTFLRVI